MSNYNLNTIVSAQETEALKEMIFKRATERAKALNDEIQASYTSDVQNDLMDIARSSFRANKNPFSFNEVKKVDENKNVSTEFSSKEEILKESKIKVKEIKEQIYKQNESVKNNILNNYINSSMNEARVTSEKKLLFTGALEYLNTQASISLVKKRDKGFEALA